MQFELCFTEIILPLHLQHQQPSQQHPQQQQQQGQQQGQQQQQQQAEAALGPQRGAAYGTAPSPYHPYRRSNTTTYFPKM